MLDKLKMTFGQNVRQDFSSLMYLHTVIKAQFQLICHLIIKRSSPCNKIHSVINETLKF